MIELNQNELRFTFPEVHPQAQLTIDFQRTLRIPDDGSDYPLPPGLGRFPMRHVDDFGCNAPASWIEHGGVMLPMYQSEALWLNFDSDFLNQHDAEYPFAVKVATGKINAATGASWENGLRHDPQDYLVIPGQPWLDGYCVEKGFIRQFVAMPLGAGYSAEEQITGKAEHGGLQIAVFPMKRESFERRFPRIERTLMVEDERVCYCARESLPAAMGLAPGGRMRQEIYEDPYGATDWDTEHISRCFVHIANSQVWRAIVGENPPSPPLTAKEYTDAGMPWFEYYSENATALNGADALKNLKSVATMGKKKRGVPLPENESIIPSRIIALRSGLKRDQVRECRF